MKTAEDYGLELFDSYKKALNLKMGVEPESFFEQWALERSMEDSHFKSSIWDIFLMFLYDSANFDQREHEE